MAVPKGSWGMDMIIITPFKHKNVSCATCTYYDRDEHSCIVKNIIPKIDGYDVWKKCNRFDLDIEYMDAHHQEQVRKVRGENFFLRERDEEAKEREDIKVQKMIVQKEKNERGKSISIETNTFAEQLRRVLEKQLNCTFSIEKHDEQDLKYKYFFKSSNKDSSEIGIVAVERLPKGKKRFDILSRWFHELMNAANELRSFENFDRKYLIIPEINLDGGKETVAEQFYKKRGNHLGKIELVEYRKNGKLMILIGPKERFWTKEKINNLRIW